MRSGGTEQVSLRVINPKVFHYLLDLWIMHKFGHYLGINVMGKVGDRLSYFIAIGIMVNTADKLSVNLYKITHSVSRTNNYEKLLTMFNDTLQGKANHLGIFCGGTPQFLEDRRRGLYSYEALHSRLVESRFIKEGLQDYSGPVMRLERLSLEEIFVLLSRVLAIHSTHYDYQSSLTETDLKEFRQRSLR